jgi:iron complex outermembrane receptor protein
VKIRRPFFAFQPAPSQATIKYRLKVSSVIITVLSLGSGVVTCPSILYADEPQVESEKEKTLTVTVRGRKGISDSIKPVQSISTETLTRTSPLTLGEALQQQPGISSTSFGPGSSRPVIRGQGGARVRILDNGVATGDISQTSDDHAVSSDIYSFDNVDILRGPGTLLYGGSAIGGVVNLTDNLIPDEPTGTPGTGHVQSMVGDDASDLRSGSASLKGENNQINYSLSASYAETDDIKIPGYSESDRLLESEGEEPDPENKGRLANSSTRTKGFNGGVSYVNQDQVHGVGIRYFSSRYGVPGHAHAHEHEEEEHSDEHEGAEHSHEHGDEDHEQEEHAGLIFDHSDDHHDAAHIPSSGTYIDLSNIRLSTRHQVASPTSLLEGLTITGAISDYKHTEYEDGTPGTVFNSDTINLRLDALHTPADAFGTQRLLTGNSGAELIYQDFNAEGEEAFIPENQVFTPALFITETAKFSNNLELSGGLRGENVAYTSTIDRNESYPLLNGAVGMAYTPYPLYRASLTASYSQRAPTATELFADGIHTATRTYEIGDLGLGKETSTGLEVRLERTQGRITGALSAFSQFYSDYINAAYTGNQIEGVNELRYEMSKARIWGGEANMTGRLSPESWKNQFALTLQFDYTRGRLTEGDNSNLPRITPIRTLTRLTHTLDSWQTGIEAQFVSPQRNTATFELPTAGYTMMNVDSSYELKAGAQRIRLFAQGTNLLNQEARVHTSFIKDLSALRGRAFTAGIRIDF